MVQAQTAQQQEQPEGRKVGQAVPVNGQRSKLQCDGVDGGVGQHGAALWLGVFKYIACLALAAFLPYSWAMVARTSSTLSTSVSTTGGLPGR